MTSNFQEITDINKLVNYMRMKIIFVQFHQCEHIKDLRRVNESYNI